MQNDPTQFVGIDIGSKAHEVCVIDRGKTRKRSITSNPADHARFIKTLDPTRCRVVMEATGVYHLDLAIDLVEAGIAVMVINPRTAHHFMKALGKRSNTDAISAQALSEFAQRMVFKPWTPPPREWLEFRAIARQINRLKKEETRAKNRVHALEATHNHSSLILRDERDGLRALSQRIERLLEAAAEAIDQSEELKRLLGHLTVAKGFREASILPILGELLLLPRTMSGKQCASHAGLDVRLKRSGISVEGKPRLSKAGNAYLRAPFFMPMLSVIQHEPLAQAHFERLIARGKTRKQAIGALMRKYLTGFWSAIRHDQPFDTSKLFAPQ